MSILPKAIVKPRPDDGLGKGMEIVVLLVLFLIVGFGLDRWLGTAPVFTIVMTVFAMVGQFIKLWYGYDARMRELEADRREARMGQTVSPQGQTRNEQ